MRIPGGIPQGAAGADLDFYHLANRYLEEIFEASPEAATAAGYHRFDHLLDDWSPTAVRHRIDQARKAYATFDAVVPDRLSPGARIDLRLVRNDIEGTLFSLIELRRHERDPQFYVDLLGNALLLLTLLEPGSPAWEARLEALLGRLRAVPDFLAAARASLGRPARVISEMVLQTNAGNLRFLEETLPPLFERAPASRPALRQELVEANARAADAVREFQGWLRDILLPRSDGAWRLGRELWTRKLRLTLQSDMTPEEILRRAHEALETLHHRMHDVAAPLHRRLFPDRSASPRGAGTGDAASHTAAARTVIAEVIAAASLQHPTRDGLFPFVRGAVDRLKRFIREADLIRLPPDDDNFVLEPTPGFLDGVAVAFFNPPPTLEPELRKSFWISSVPRGATPEETRTLEESFLREYNEYSLQGLAIHEAFPGHYVQYWHALRSPLATIYKNIFSSGTFAEGWAVLAEGMMYEAGYAKDEPENLLMHLKHGLRAPMNALLDARLHTSEEPEEEADRWALDLLTRTGFQEEAEARGKLRRAKVTSTQLSTYFVGLTEMRDLLTDSRRAAGPAFNLKDWNDRVLLFGTIPPRDVRALMGLEPHKGTK